VPKEGASPKSGKKSRNSADNKTRQGKLYGSKKFGPISLTNVAWKVMEKLLVNRIRAYAFCI